MGYDLGGSFALGQWPVHRAGYGAMQLAGDGVSGRRATVTRRCGCCGRWSRRGSTTLIPPSSTARAL